MKIFLPVLAAILVAAGFIGAVVVIRNQMEATERAESAFQENMHRTNAKLRYYKSISKASSPYPVAPRASTATPEPSRSESLIGAATATPLPQLRKHSPGPSPATPPEFVVLTAPAEVPLPYGKATLQPGTRLKFISRAAGTVSVLYLDRTVTIPISSTDLK